MKKTLVIFFAFLNILIAQISVSDLNKISNAQLDAIRSELQKSQSQQVQSDIPDNQELSTVSIESIPAPTKDPYFGYNIFDRKINFFENIPVPTNFTLGPGDKIIISLWGETNFRTRFTISRDGTIFYENIGFINLNNKTISEAEETLSQQLSSIYSTLNDKENPTELKVEIESLKSINVYFTGFVKNPGVNIVHPFSDVYTALIQSGGIDYRGSLRKIVLKRNGKAYSSFDFYSLIVDGDNNFADVRMMDGDTIHVPEVNKRVFISGDVMTKGFYEISNDEKLDDLINYAGLSASSSTSLIINRIIDRKSRTSNDFAQKSFTVDINDDTDFELADGDRIQVLSTPGVNTLVNVIGNVKKPDFYPAEGSLKNVLDLAGGFNDPEYAKKLLVDEIVVIRNNEKSLFNDEFIVSYEDSNNFLLQPGDTILVYSNTLYERNYFVQVQGEVNKVGTFSINNNTTTLKNIIDNYAKGLNEFGSIDNIVITELFSTVDSNGNLIEERKVVKNISMDYVVNSDAIIQILPKSNLVEIVGNVYNPGLVQYDRGKSLRSYIILSGGYKQDTLKNKVYVKRANGQIKKVSFFKGRFIRIKNGDQIIVPADPNPKDFNINSFIADLSTTLANVAAILILVENQSN